MARVFGANYGSAAAPRPRPGLGNPSPGDQAPRPETRLDHADCQPLTVRGAVAAEDAALVVDSRLAVNDFQSSVFTVLHAFSAALAGQGHDTQALGGQRRVPVQVFRNGPAGGEPQIPLNFQGSYHAHHHGIDLRRIENETQGRLPGQAQNCPRPGISWRTRTCRPHAPPG